MSAAVRGRVDLDTAGVSSGLSRVGKASSAAVAPLSGALPILGQMTSSVGLIGAAVFTGVSAFRQWNDQIKRGNELLTEAVTKSGQLAAGTGDFGQSEFYRAAAGSIAGQGALGQNEVLASIDAFRGENRSASVSVSRRAGELAQVAGSSGYNAEKVASLAGLIMVLVGGDMPIELAFDYAAKLNSELGSEADRAARTLPQLMQRGLSLDQAVAVMLQFADLGRSGISSAISALQTAAPGQLRTTAGLQSVLRSSNQLTGATADRVISGIDLNQASNANGTLARAFAGVTSDEQRRIQFATMAERNALAVDQQSVSDPTEELIRARQERADVGIIDPLGVNRAGRFLQRRFETRRNTEEDAISYAAFLVNDAARSLLRLEGTQTDQ